MSKDGLDRAYQIAAALITALDGRGLTLAVETRRQEKKEQTVAKIYGQAIRFSLTEKIDRVEIAAPSEGCLLERLLTYEGKPVTLEPSGRLSIEVGRSGAITYEIGETENPTSGGSTLARSGWLYAAGIG